MKEYMLTTIDNPFDPFTQWEEWDVFDRNSGYYSAGLLARIARSSSDLSEADQRQAINDAVDEIVDLNVLGVYRKVERDVVSG